MNTSLRHALEDLAEKQSFTPDPSAWDRGRRARRRDRAVTAALTLCLVASLGGLATLFTTGADQVAPADDTTAKQVDGPQAVPQVVEPPGDISTPDTLAVGRASVAYVLDDDRPVVVGSMDGHHRALDLEGWRPGSPLALSPAGDHLLWVQSRGGTTSQQLAVADLNSGEVVELDTPADADEAINHVAWAPGSRRVAWVAQEADGSSVRSANLRRRTIDDVHWLLPERATSVAVGDRGDLAVGIDGGVVHLDRREDSTRTVHRPFSVRPAAFSPSGAHVALASDRRTATYTLDTALGDVVSHAFPDDTFTRASARPLGWLDDRLQLLLVQPARDESAELVITTPEVNETSTWRRRVGSVDADLVPTVTVAVDLLPGLDGSSSQRFTRDFSESEDTGGMPVEPTNALALLVVALAVLLLVVLVGRAAVRRGQPRSAR